ncbi:Meprin A subunit beta [Halocaridina rubra]|uniref:Metalloendopeptidase n=1 Tax=Halocaridina rubra TaxID=373956 RepID=A0AAN8XHH1_HALRR
MKIPPRLCIFLLIGLVHKSFSIDNQKSISKGGLPDVIIGDPNETENDILGPPISHEEFRGSLNLTINHLDLKMDPITTSNYFQGDIILPSEDHLLQILEGDPQGQLSAIRNPDMTWPEGVIPYVISSSFNNNERSVIARAMSEYHQRTCIRFVPRRSHSDYIHILRGQGCSSAVGRTRGVQVVSLGFGCVHFGVILHELMHAAGFWHEQSRYDRDDHVIIYWNNILSGLEYNFEKKSSSVTTDLGLPYDYSSIMHYGPYAFTKRYGSATIAPRRSGVTIGQRNGFSESDVEGLNLLYKCSGVEPKPENCEDEHRFCSDWASRGYCTLNPGYMLVNCKKSCDNCGGSRCSDRNNLCNAWARNGECSRNPGYMHTNCQKACERC